MNATSVIEPVETSDQAGQARPRRRRVARGPRRPVYLGHPDTDRVMIALVALVSEVSALRDRIDTHERLAEQGQAGTFAAVEAFSASEVIAQARRGDRRRMIDRVLRVLLEQDEDA